MNKGLRKGLSVFGFCLWVGAGVVLGGCSPTNRQSAVITKIENNDKTQIEQEEKRQQALYEMERINLLNDTDLFIELNNTLMTNLEKLEPAESRFDTSTISNLFANEETGEETPEATENDEVHVKTILAIQNYMHDVYRLGCSRLESHKDDLDSLSEEYQTYLAMIASYTTAYSEDFETLYERLMNGEDEIESLNALNKLEVYYLEITAACEG